MGRRRVGRRPCHTGLVRADCPAHDPPVHSSRRALAPLQPLGPTSLMFIARVVGDVVATHRHGELGGRKLLLVRRLSTLGREEGAEVVALDVIGVGVGERVLVVQEGGAARSLSKSARIPAQAVVVGVVDRVDLSDGEVPEEGR